MSRLNDYLCELLQAVDQYIADGESEENCPEWFNSKDGICDNWNEYTDNRMYDHAAWKLGREGLRDKFTRSELGDLTPFNSSLDEYLFESRNHEIWLNDQRVDWLRNEVKRIQDKRSAA